MQPITDNWNHSHCVKLFFHGKNEIWGCNDQAFKMLNLWRRKWQPTPLFLPGKSHGQRSLAGYSPRGCRESDTTEATNTERAKTSTVFTQTNQGCMVLAVNAIGICTGMSKCWNQWRRGVYERLAHLQKGTRINFIKVTLNTLWSWWRNKQLRKCKNTFRIPATKCCLVQLTHFTRWSTLHPGKGVWWKMEL